MSKNTIQPDQNALPIADTTTTLETTDTNAVVESTPVYNSQNTTTTTTATHTTNTANAPATFSLTLDSEPNHSQDFNFTVKGISSESGVSGYSQIFALDDDQTNTLSNTKTLQLVPGTYSVSKTEPAGWASSWLCTPGFPEEEVNLGDGNTHVIDIGSGRSIECIYRSILVM